MNCPGCGQPLAGGARCACGVGLPVEGALAPDLSGRRVEPIRELPGRRRDKSWKDEVRDRVKERRRTRSVPASPLPLFPDPPPAELETPSSRSGSQRRFVPAAPPRSQGGSAAEDPVLETPLAPTLTLEDLTARPAEREASVHPSPATAEADLLIGDLPLQPPPPSKPGPPAPARPAAPERPRPEPVARLAPPAPAPPPPAPVMELADDAAEDWPLTATPPAAASREVERPASFAERFQAGALDFALLLSLGAVAVYFASRAAHVPVAGLRPAWPWLAGYVAFLGLAYAAYFTGTTGQTLGKMALGLRVVDTAGRPPSYPTAAARALLGALGIACAGLGAVPIALDPARRAAHDQLLRTRVIKG